MDTSGLITALERDGRAFLASCQAAPQDEFVATCPEWRPVDLLWHLTEVHWFWRSIVEQRAQHHTDVGQLERPGDSELPELYRIGLGALVTALATTDPATQVWTWAAEKHAGFVIRRMAHETAVHRWDADRAAGAPVPIDAALASDGIDEFLTHFVNDPREGAVLGGSVHIHCTDVPGEWTTRPSADGLVTSREHAKGACALRAPADVLLRALWRRASLEDLDVVGDRDVAAQFLAYANLR